MPCPDMDKLSEKLEKARAELARAQLGVSSAESNLNAARLAYAAAIAAEFACALTVETGPGFVVCEAAAVASALSAAEWIESAEAALEIAKGDLQEAKAAYEEALNEFCECIEDDE